MNKTVKKSSHKKMTKHLLASVLIVILSFIPILIFIEYIPEYAYWSTMSIGASYLTWVNRTQVLSRNFILTVLAQILTFIVFSNNDSVKRGNKAKTKEVVCGIYLIAIMLAAINLRLLIRNI